MAIDTLFVEKAVIDVPLVQDFSARLETDPIVVEDEREVYAHVQAAIDPIQRGKEVLFLCRNKGAFLRDCPGTRAYRCCDYKILHIGTFCQMDCAYCILQAYFHPPVLRYFVNQACLLKELEAVFEKNAICRIGTGEFTDSLIWDIWSDLSSLLVPLFAGQSQAVLELKTKTTAIAKLEKIVHNGKTIMAWSLNTPEIISHEEHKTASLSARLEAAAKCEFWGYPLAFHFDPMVIYEGCEDDYRSVIEKLFAMISPERIVWISLGTFRFMPALKGIIEKRFSDSKIVYGEFITGLDGKMRYFKPLRIALYRQMVSWIRALAPQVTVYLCMEDDEVWQKAFGFIPSQKGGLAVMLDKSAAIHCGLNG
jgi:spore photoproduct lyase